MVIKDKLVDVDVNNKFVRIIRKNSLEEDEKNDIAESLKEDGALSVDFRFEPEEQIVSIERVELSENKGFYGIIEDYVGSDIVNTEGFDMDRLLSVGKDILSDVIE